MIMSSGPVAQMGVNVNGLMMMRQHQQQQQLQIQLHSQNSNSSSISSNSNHHNQIQNNNRQNNQNPTTQNQNQNQTQQSQLDIEFDGTTVLCRVCGDKASGFHYGVHSCEGCKGFFRRSIQQKIQYRPCTKNQQCSILRVNRNRCQYCRLKKCISVGMSRDAVRFGRVPKREKAKILAAMQQCHVAKSAERALTQELEDLTALKDTVVTAHMETCEFTRSRVDQMFLQNDKKNTNTTTIKLEPGVDQEQTFENDSCPESFKFPKTNSSSPQQPFLLLACPLNPYQNMKQQTDVDGPEVGPGGPSDDKKAEPQTTDFSERFSPAIRGVVEFAKRLPGFNLLSQDDQVTLLKAGVFEVLLVRFSCMFRKDRMMCVNGQVVHHDRPQNGQQGGQASSEGQNGRFLLDSMFKFAEQFNIIGLIDHQLALFCAIVILAPDRPGLRNTDLVQKLNSALRNCIIILNNSNNGSSACHLNSIQLLQELDKKIPDLRTLNTLHSEKLVAFKMSQENAQNAQNGEDYTYGNSTTNILNQVIMKRFEIKKEILEDDEDDYESSIMDDDRSYVTDRDQDQDFDDSVSLSGRSLRDGNDDRHHIGGGNGTGVSGRKLTKYFGGHHGSSVMISPPSTPLSVCSTYSNHSILSAPPSPLSLSQNSLVYSSICNYNKQDTLQLIAQQQQRRRSSSNSNYSNSSSASSTCSNSNYFSQTSTGSVVQLQGQDLSSGSSRSIPSSPSSVNSNYSSIDSGVESLSNGSPSGRKRKLYNMMGSEFYDKRSKKYQDHESDDHGSVKSINDHEDLDQAQFDIDHQGQGGHQNHQVEEAMPVLKRALQAPPLFSSTSANSSKSTAQQQNLKMIEDLLYNSHQQQQQQQQQTNGESNSTQQSNGEFVRHKKFRYYNVNSNSSESSNKSEKSSKSEEQMLSPPEPIQQQQQQQQQNGPPKSILVETLTSGSKVSNGHGHGHGQSNYNSIGNCFYSGNNLRVSDILSTNPSTASATTTQQQQQQNSQFKMPQSSPHHQTSPRPPPSQGISPNSHQLTRKLLSQGPPTSVTASQNESKLSQLLLAEAIHGPKQNEPNGIDKMGFLSRLKFEQASDLIHSVVMSAPNARNGQHVHNGPHGPPPSQSAHEVDGKIKMLLNSNSAPLNLVTNKNFK